MTPEHRRDLKKLMSTGMFKQPIAHSEDGITAIVRAPDGTELKRFLVADWDSKTHSVRDRMWTVKK